MLEDRKSRCVQILQCIDAINDYMETIHEASDFLTPKTGPLRLDAVTLRLQVIGENAKKIESGFPLFFWNEFHFDIGSLIRLRDFISHHYERLDYQIIYDLCQHRLPKLEAAIKTYLESPT